MLSAKSIMICSLPIVLLGGCGSPSTDTSAQTEAVDPTSSAPVASSSPAVSSSPVASSASHAAWAGRWIGVEGMYLNVTPVADGSYQLEMQSDLDTNGTYVGRDAANGIRFERGGRELLLKAATGDQTGLKWLAGKTDCLMVETGEGYCREG